MMNEEIRKNARAVSMMLEYVAEGRKDLTEKQVQMVNTLFNELYRINRDTYKEEER